VAPLEAKPLAFANILEREIGSGRIARDRKESTGRYEDRYDDVGGYDSIFLAASYQSLLALSGTSSDLNQEWVDASKLPIKALQSTGVRFVITSSPRRDLRLLNSADGLYLYRVPTPAPRATVLTGSQIRFVKKERIPELLPAAPANQLLLPAETTGALSTGESRLVPDESTFPTTAAYSRPSSDSILLHITTAQSGYVRLLEAYDPGWTATVDDKKAPLLPANGFAIAVPVPSGKHTIDFRYRTPGRTTGALLSVSSLCLLITLVLFGDRSQGR
jgi:hypothetical protein